MQPKVLRDLEPILDIKHLVDGADYRQAIFVFISHVGAEEIKQHYEKLLAKGKKRREIVPKDFERIIEESLKIQGKVFH